MQSWYDKYGIMQILLESPILRESELEAIRGGKHSLKSQTFSLYYQSGKSGAMAEALTKLTSDIEQAVRDGCEIVILSDKLPEGESIDIERPPIQTLLAVGATHHHLIKYASRSLMLVRLLHIHWQFCGL